MPTEDIHESKPRLIDQQNRVALPSEVLETLGVSRGDYVVFVVEGRQVRVHRAVWAVE